MNTGSKSPAYDRQLLLEGAKRNTILDLTEVQRYGIESWSDPDYVCIYGLRPADWYGRGIRILGRTAVECTRDVLADKIGGDISTVAMSSPFTSEPLILDPFVGSGNTHYWMLRHLPGAHGLGLEQDPMVFQLTSRNLATLDPASEAELIPRFSWSAKQTYRLNAPGQNHGLFMGTRGWVPSNPLENP